MESVLHCRTFVNNFVRNMKKGLSPTVAVRLAPSLRQAFIRKSNRYGGTSEVLRELVAAFVESRLTIQPPKEVKESLYDRI